MSLPKLIEQIETVERLERELSAAREARNESVREFLRTPAGNVSQAARLLGVSRAAIAKINRSGPAGV